MKNKRSVEESLQAFIVSEAVGGVAVDDSDDSPRVTVQKRTVVGKLPRLLWLHCQRFVFDYDKVCFYLPLHFKRILLTILTCPPHI